MASDLAPELLHSIFAPIEHDPQPHTADGDQKANGPYRLQLVYLYSCAAPEGPTPLFRILSLCEIDTIRATLNQLPGTDTASVRLGVAQRPPPLLEALHRSLESGCVRELDVTLHTWDDVRTAGALLRNAGRNLAALRLNVCWDSESGEEDVVGDRWRALGLSECPQLETFEFEFPSCDNIVPDRSGNACANGKVGGWGYYPGEH